MNALIEIAGQISAIVICLFMLVFVISAVAFNLAMAFGMSWLEQKIHIVKLLRPTVESVNKATESALEGHPSDGTQNVLIHTVASIPPTAHNVEKKVDKGADKVADAVIEFRARTVQAKTIFKAFFLPGSIYGKQERTTGKAAAELNSSSEQMSTRERPVTVTAESAPHRNRNETKHGTPEEQIQHAARR